MPYAFLENYSFGTLVIAECCGTVHVLSTPAWSQSKGRQPMRTQDPMTHQLKSHWVRGLTFRLRLFGKYIFFAPVEVFSYLGWFLDGRVSVWSYYSVVLIHEKKTIGISYISSCASREHSHKKSVQTSKVPKIKTCRLLLRFYSTFFDRYVIKEQEICFISLNIC